MALLSCCRIGALTSAIRRGFQVPFVTSRASFLSIRPCRLTERSGVEVWQHLYCVPVPRRTLGARFQSTALLLSASRAAFAPEPLVCPFTERGYATSRNDHPDCRNIQQTATAHQFSSLCQDPYVLPRSKHETTIMSGPRQTAHNTPSQPHLGAQSQAPSSFRNAATWADAAPPPVSIADWRAELDAQEPMRSALKYLEKFTNHERKGVPKGAGTDSEEGFPLRRMELLMQRLGDPVSELKVVHIAGTKGKGSVAALLAASLRCAGLRVGVYSSPHFLTVRERIAIDGVPISPDAFAALVAAYQPVLDEMYNTEGVTHFEVLTALAYKHFEEEGVNVAVMEAGLGGARDATNVIPPQSLLLAVITAIHEEHLEALGGSLAAIVRAKCGIIKEGRPVLLAPQQLDILTSVEAAARVKGAPLHTVTKADAARLSDVGYRPGDKDASERPVDCKPLTSAAAVSELTDREGSPGKSRGGVLWENAATAFQAARIVLRQVSPSTSLPAVPLNPASALPPGRAQRLTEREAEKLGLCGKTVILDGAHTPLSFHELRETLWHWRGSHAPPKVLFIIAMSKDKDHRQCLLELHGSGLNLQTPIFTEVPVAGAFERATPAEALSECWSEITKASSSNGDLCEPDFGTALSKAAAAPDDVVVSLTGSMHLVGAALAKVAGVERNVRRK